MCFRKFRVSAVVMIALLSNLGINGFGSLSRVPTCNKNCGYADSSGQRQGALE